MQAVDAVVAGSFPQLTFAIGNAGAPNTIYITTDPSVNRLTFTIRTNAAATMTPGRPVPYRQASGASGTLLYLDLSKLQLSDAEFDALVCSADGWAFGAYSADHRICMAPTSALSLAAGDEVSIHVDHLTLANPPDGPSVQLTDIYYRVGNITIGNLGVPSDFQTLLQQAPSGGADLHDDIQLGVPQPYVITSVGDYQGFVNRLQLQFGPGSRQRVVRAGSRTAFTLTFVYADGPPGYGALCTGGEGSEIVVGRGQGADQWEITKAGEQQHPSWLLQPPSGAPIVGSESVVELEIDDLVTTLAGGPTLMLVGYSDIPGYADGSFAITLQKVPHVQITSFDVQPNPVVLHDGKADVTLTWTVQDAGALTLMPLYKDVTGTTRFSATISDTTQFTLEADGLVLPNLGNHAIRNVTAVVLPVIDAFTATPGAIFTDDFPRETTLSWNVDTGGDVRLISSLSGADPNEYAPTGYVTKSLDAPQMFTLVPVEDPLAPRVRRSIVISAFDPAFASVGLQASASAVALAPLAGYAVVTDAGGGTVTPLDTVAYQPIVDPIAVGSGPVAVTFTPDGTRLLVANGGDGTVSVIEVTPQQDGWPPYAFDVVQTLNVGGTPAGIATSPDGRYLYVTIGNGQAPGALVVSTRDGSGHFGTPSSFTVGRDPRGVAVAPSGAQVFVANAGDDTVSVMGVSSGGGHQLVTTLTGLASEPDDLVVTADNRVLLVTCAGSSSVFAIDVQYPDTAPRAQLEVGRTPRQIALVPGGGYALVVDDDGASVALLSLGSRPQTCSVLAPSIAAGSRPRGLAVSPEAGLALVTQEGSSALGVLTLAEYAQRESPTELGAGPTSLAITPDGKKLFAWHDGLASLPPQQSSTGFCVYELESSTVTPQAQGTAFVELAVVRDRSAPAGVYAIAQDGTAVEVRSTENYQPLFEVDLSDHTSGTPQDLAISDDGTALFVLAGDDDDHYELVPFTVDVAGQRSRPLGTVAAFDASMGTAVFLLASPDGAHAYAIDSIDETLWTADRQANGSYAFRASSLDVPNAPAAAAISPDGAALYVLGQGGMNNSISAVDTAAGTVRTVYLPSIEFVSLNGLTVSPDGTRIFAADGVRAGIRIFDAASLRLIQTISWTRDVRMPYGVAVMPDGSQVFTANAGSANLAIAQQVQPGVRQPA